MKVLLNTYKAEFGRTRRRQHRDRQQERQHPVPGQRVLRTGAATSGTPTRGKRTVPDFPRRSTTSIPTASIWAARFKIPGLYGNGSDDRKLFFFYSFEGPQVQRPGPTRLFRVPTALERQGNFSQSIDTTGRAVTVVDPVTRVPFAGNIIPANRIDPNMQRLLNMLPLPNQAGDNFTYNFSRLETSENPRWNNLLRIDNRSSGGNSIWGVLRDVQLEPVRLGDHRGAGTVGILQRRLPLLRQLGERRLEPTSSARTSSTSSRPGSARRPRASRPRTTATGRESARATWGGRWGSSIRG